MKSHNHGLWMILCCALPLLAIFLLPGFGAGGNFSILFFVIVMFACHFMMMGGHQHGEENTDHKTEKEEDEHKEHKEGGHHGCH